MLRKTLKLTREGWKGLIILGICFIGGLGGWDFTRATARKALEKARELYTRGLTSSGSIWIDVRRPKIEVSAQELIYHGLTTCEGWTRPASLRRRKACFPCFPPSTIILIPSSPFHDKMSKETKNEDGKAQNTRGLDL